MASKFVQRLLKATAAVGFGVRSAKGQDDSLVPMISSGAGAPSATDPGGSLYLRTDGDQNTGLYATAGGGTWLALDGVFAASGTIAAGATAGNLNSAPQTIVAAPGAGKYVEVQSIHWFLDYATAAYDGTKTGNLMAKYTNGSGDEVVGQVAETGFMDQTADTHAVTHGIDCVPVANAAIVAHASNDWFSAAGDSPVKYEVIYRIRSIDPAA